MKSGFSLVSVMVSMALSTILLSAVFMIYNSIGRTSKFVKRVAGEDLQEIVFIKRIKQDFLGISTLWNVNKAADKTGQQSSAEIKNAYFCSINKDGILDFLTFVSTSSLSSYGSNPPRFVRVVYKLDSDPLNEGMYRLMRKEVVEVSGELSDKQLKSGAFSELVGNISSIQINYFYVKKQDERQAQAQGLEEESLIGRMLEWDPEKKETQKITKDSLPLLAEINVTFGKQKRKINAKYKVDILVDASVKISPVQPVQSDSKGSASENGGQSGKQ